MCHLVVFVIIAVAVLVLLSFGCWVSCFVLEFVLKLAGIAKDDDAPLLPRRKPRKEKPKQQSQTEEPPNQQSDGYEYSDHD